MKEAIFSLIIIFTSIIILTIVIDVSIRKINEFKSKRDKKRFEELVNNMKLKGVKYNPDGSCEELDK